MFQLLSRVNRNLLSVATYALKLNLAVNKREQSIVRADTYVVSGVNMSSALSYENITSKHELTVCSLNTKSLGLGIATVLGRTHSLFMSEIL